MRCEVCGAYLNPEAAMCSQCKQRYQFFPHRMCLKLDKEQREILKAFNMDRLMSGELE